jgi:hypothetical protein
MSKAPTQFQSEKPQQVLRFTVRDPVLDEAIVSLEREGNRHGEFLPDNLFLYSMKRIVLEESMDPNESELTVSQFGQYRKKMFDIANRGNKEFTLDPELHEIQSGGQSGELAGVGFRVRFSDFDRDSIIAPPLYGSSPRTNAHDDPLNRRNAEKLLAEARGGGYIPIYYKIGRTMDDPEFATERLRSVLRLGVKVAELAVVPLLFRAGRETNIYATRPMERTYDKVDAFFDARINPDHQNV